MHLNFLIIIFSSVAVIKVWAQCWSPNGFFPHESECDRYYECRKGVVVRRGLCPDGLVFDGKSRRKLRCVHPFGIDCRNRPKTQKAKSSPHCPRRNGYYADKEDCTKFYNCDDGRAFQLSCPPGLAYDEYTGTCNWPDLVDACSSEQIVNFVCPEPSDNELLEYGYPRYETSDCAKFVICVESEIDGQRSPRLLGCEAGKVFNPVTKFCDLPYNVPNCVNYYGEMDFLRMKPLRRINYLK